MSLKPCKFTPEGTTKELNFDEFRAYLLENYDSIVPPTREFKGEGRTGENKRLRGTIEAFVDRSDLDQETKDALLNNERNYMETLGIDDAKSLAQEIVNELGVEGAVSAADRNQVPASLQSLVYGEALNYAKEEGKKAKTKEEKNKWADFENEVHTKLAEKATEFGRFNAYIQSIYYQSGYALVRKVKQEIERRNKIFAPKAKKAAKEIKEILDSPNQAEEAIEQAVAEAVTQAVSEKEKQIKDLEKRLAELEKEPKKSSGKRRNPIVSKDAYENAKKVLFGRVSANPFLNPEVWQALGTIAAYHLERGYYKFEDFYRKMLKDTKGKYEDYYGDLYQSARERAIEDGIDPLEFDDNITVEEKAEILFQEKERLKQEIEQKKKEAQEAKQWQGKGLDKTIKEALIEAGYGKEVAGKQQVDWRKVTGSSKDAGPIVEKIKKVLEGKIPAGQLSTLLSAIENRANQIISEKKAQAIKTKVKQINKYKNLGIHKAISRNTRIQGLVETWRQGGLTDKDILEKLASDFGIITFTDADEKIVEDLIEQIDKAQEGAEKERLEEKLQAFLEYAGAPNFLARAFFQRMKARLLSGPITLLKNLTGAVDAAMSTAYLGFVNQFDGIKPVGDKQIAKTFFKAHRKAFITALDILWRGGVDTGTALSERTKNKEGAPSVRYAENPRSSFKKVGLFHRAGSIVDVVERPFMRFMAAADAFNQVLLQEVSAYSFTKQELKKKYPNLSSSELSKMAYDITYAQEISDAEIQAEQEFKDRGVDLTADGVAQKISNWARFNRRVHEIVEQKRTEKTLRASQFFGNRYTYKAYDPGIVSGATYFVQQIKNAATKSMGKLKKSDNPSVVRAAETVDFAINMAFEWAMPFVKTIGNIMEKSLELWAPYGAVKGLAYTGYAAYNKATDNQQSDINMRRAGEYYWRAAMGLGLTALLLAMVDDDEEDKEEALYGEGPENWAERKNRAKQRPKNTIRIGGNNVSLDWFGSLALPLKIEAEKLDEMRYNKEDAFSIGFLINLFNEQYFEKTGQLITAVGEAVNNGEDKKIKTLLTNEALELGTRAMVPSTQFVRQAGQLIKGEAKKPITFVEKFQKYLGIGQITLDRPALDYRGKGYDVGQMFSSSADGFKKMFTDAIQIDDVDKFVFKYHPGIMQPRHTDEAFAILQDGEYSPMPETDFYDITKATGENLNKLLTPYVKNKIRPEMSDLTDSKMTKYVRATEEEFVKAGKTLNEKAVLDQAIKMAEKELMAEGYKKDIEKMNSLAKEAATEDWYKKRKLRPPYEIMGAKGRYDEFLRAVTRAGR